MEELGVGVGWGSTGRLGRVWGGSNVCARAGTVAEHWAGRAEQGRGLMGGRGDQGRLPSSAARGGTWGRGGYGNRGHRDGALQIRRYHPAGGSPTFFRFQVWDPPSERLYYS